ncbi:pyrroline-5-carboxylate reductase [Alkalihalobacillus xiaoxiensis]|uniref:Pyrroline-5-carboxylate reductase n=1 Tax=Shouchella xiaoxiensis TaxID=766895 RepID=A0ABS2STN7_9BACI|nr:pyrroline-5-carboxylate reductase [Shouchella xiaoxiensis]
MTQAIACIGAGSMAEAIIGGLCAGTLNPNISVTNLSDESKLIHLEETYQVTTSTDYEETLKNKQVILLAVKPHHLYDAIQCITPYLQQNQLVISVVAGVTLATLERWLPENTSIIRAMPNTSAKVHASATALALGSSATGAQLHIATELFSSIGSVQIVTDEQMNVTTGIAGSGPAYFYLVAEAMIEAAMEENFPADEARSFVTQTMFGAAIRLRQTEKSPKVLYEEIMSPNGTTEAAIHFLKHNGVDRTFKEAIHKAIHRSRELAQRFAYDPAKKE